jgi:hypothetical protein
LVPVNTLSVAGVGATLTTVTGGVYKIGIAPYNTSTNQITSTPTYTSTYTESAGAAAKFFYRTISFSMTANSAYILFIVRTDSTTTVSQTINFGAGGWAFPGIATASSGTAKILASTGPTTSDTWSSSGGGAWSLLFVYSI